MRRSITLKLATLLAILLMPAKVRAASPELHAVFPTGVQRGTSFELSLHGKRLADSEEVLFYRDGVRVESLSAEENKLTAKCTIDADCELGELSLRIRTRSGLTEMRTLYVGALPVVAEAEPNNAFESAQSIPQDCTIDGRITREDIDYFVVEAKAGERITAEIEAMRLARTMFDPYVAILDAKKFELSVSDDSILLMQDGVASTVAKNDGRYYVLVRDASFEGNDQSYYRLHVGRFPRPRVAFPPGGRPGEKLAIEFRGDEAGPIRRELEIPAGANGEWPVYVQDDTGVSPSPVWLCIGNESVVNETETSENAPINGSAKPPAAFQGVLSEPAESDDWAFSASKGQQLSVRVIGREIRSPIDSVISVLGPDGKGIGSNDDARSPDSELTFTAPSDGFYKLSIRDQLYRGGPRFVYRIEIADREPTIELSTEMRDKRRPQFLQAIEVPRGNRFAGLYRVSRKDVGGPADLRISGLPAGVTAHCMQLDKDESLVPVVFEATIDGPLAGALCEMTAQITQGDRAIAGRYRQPIPLVIGPPNEQTYYETHVDRLAVALTEPAPFRVEVVPPPIPLLRDGAGSLHIEIQRDEGFESEIETWMLWNPPGISSAGNIKIPAKAVSADYPINASGDAPLRTHQLVILAHANVGGADRWVSSGLIPLEVADHFVTGGLKMCAIQRGESAGMVCNLNQIRPFEGEAKMELKGLPPGVSTEPVTVKPDQKDAVFTLVAKNDAPLGRHGGLFCEITSQVKGAPSSHRLAGGGVIRIDAIPAKVAQATPKPKPEPKPDAKPAPPKPLSRLQQLRKQAEQRKSEQESDATEKGK